MFVESNIIEAQKHFNLASKLQEEKKINEAIKEYLAALEIDPENIAGWIELGKLYKLTNNQDEVIGCYQKIIDVNSTAAFWIYSYLGNLLLEKGQFKEAKNIYEQAIKLYPKHHEGYQGLGIIEGKLGQTTDQIINYRKSLELEPQQPLWLYSSLAKLLIETETIEEAISVCQKGIELYPKKADLYRFLGMAQEKFGDKLGQIESYKKALELEPKQPVWVYSILAELLAEEKEVIGAGEVYLNACNIYPDYTKQFYQRAIEINPQQPFWVYKQVEKLTKEKSELTRDVPKVVSSKKEKISRNVTEENLSTKNQDLKHPSVYIEKGQKLVEQGEIEKAIAVYKTAIELYPDLAGLYREIGIAYEKKGNKEAEIASYQKALELDNYNPYWVYPTLAKLLVEKKQSQEAIAVCQEGIKIYADRAEIYRFLGMAQGQEKDEEGQIKSYLEAIKIDEKQPLLVYTQLSALLLKKKRYQEVLEILTKGIQLFPKQADFYTFLAAAEHKIGDLQKAINYYFQAINLKLDQPNWVYSVLTNLVLNEENTPQLKRLSQCYNKALGISPNNVDLNYYYGLVLTAQKELNKAIDTYHRVIELNPHHWEAYQNLGDIFLEQGKQEKANQAHEKAETEFYQAHSFSKVDVPKDFDWQTYLALNTDLKMQSKWQALEHFMNNGIKEPRMYSLAQFYDPKKRPEIADKSVFRAYSKSLIPKAKKLGVLIHIYYFELWAELFSYLQNIEEDCDIFINIVESIWSPYIHEKLRKDVPKSKIIISKNRGKDIGGYLALMAHIDCSQYDIFCLLHTKKTPQKPSMVGEIWRKSLLDAILGSKEKVRTNLMMMRQDSKIGSLGSRYWRSTSIENNEEKYNYFLDQFNIKPEVRDCEYISGTMMLIRPQILELIYEKVTHSDLEDGDKKDISFHNDGQIAHALERIIGNLIKNQGMYFFWQE